MTKLDRMKCRRLRLTLLQRRYPLPDRTASHGIRGFLMEVIANVEAALFFKNKNVTELEMNHAESIGWAKVLDPNQDRVAASKYVS
jgi:hypothetical protein